MEHLGRAVAVEDVAPKSVAASARPISFGKVAGGDADAQPVRTAGAPVPTSARMAANRVGTP